MKMARVVVAGLRLLAKKSRWLSAVAIAPGSVTVETLALSISILVSTDVPLNYCNKGI
jgi:hypothetical protein